MKDLILVGSGGCMQELLWQIYETNKLVDDDKKWKVRGYIDTVKNDSKIIIDKEECIYLGNDDYLLELKEKINVAVCVGEPHLRKKIIKKLMSNKNINFPSIILKDSQICPNVTIGQGCIISMNCIVSTEVVLKDFSFLNMGVMVCHQGYIGEFTTLSPNVKLAGNVTIGKECNIGMSTNVIQGVTIGDNVITGAGSVVIKNVDSNLKVAGVPVRII